LNRQAGTLIILGTKRPLTGRNALVEIEGEDYDGQSGATKEDSNDATLGQSVSVAGAGSLYFENVDFTDGGVAAVQLRVKTQAEASVELHADSSAGTLLGKCTLSNTSNAWATQTCTLSQTATGVARLYLVFGSAAHLNWLKFDPATIPAGTGGAGAGGSTGGGTGTTTASGTGGAAGSGRGGSGAGGTRGSSASGGTTGGRGSGGATSSGDGGTTGGAGSSGTTGGSSGGAGSGGAASGGVTGSGGSSGGAGGKTEGCSCRTGCVDRSSGAWSLAGLLVAVFALLRPRARRQGKS
jgi:hypothetical protein